MGNLTRGVVAQRAGVNSETVRYYEQRGLIPAPTRSEAGYRIYTEDYIERIQFIKRAQELGFSLKKIEELLQLRVDAGADMGEVKVLVEEKIDDVEEKIRDLKRMKKALSSLAASCCGQGSTSACPILDAMKGEVVAS